MNTDPDDWEAGPDAYPWIADAEPGIDSRDWLRRSTCSKPIPALVPEPTP